MGVRRLGVQNPNANTDTNLYIASSQMLMSVIATNTASAQTDITIWVEPSGSSASTEYAYFAHNLGLDSGNSFETFRFAANQNDTIKVRSSQDGTSFAAYGIVQYDVNLGVGISSYSASAPSDPIEGLLWVDSNDNSLKVYNGSSWSVLRKEESRYTFTATGGETSVSGEDDNTNTLAYEPGYEKVFLNGILLLQNDDYTATNGTSITGLESLSAGYILEVFSI